MGKTRKLIKLFVMFMALWCWCPQGWAGIDDKAQSCPFEIRFTGNQALLANTLRQAAAQELEDFGRLGCRRADADDAAFQMETAFRKEGYAFVNVDFRYEYEQERLVVIFEVSEGPRVLINSIEFEGNTAFSKGELRPFFIIKKPGLLDLGNMAFVEEDVRAGISAIQELYIRNGFLDVEVAAPVFDFSPDQSRIIVLVPIREKTRFVISEIHFSADVEADLGQDLKELQDSLVNTPYFPRRKLVLQSKIVQLYVNQGFPEVEVVISEQAGEEEGKVVLVAAIQKGEKVRITKIMISGNEKTRPDFIRNRIAFRINDIFSLDKQRESFRRLYRTGLFSKVNIELQKEEKDTNRGILQVKVEEVPSREVSIEPGWGSYEQFRMRFGLRDRNLFGTGRIARTELGWSLKGESLVQGFTDPWFLNSSVTADFPISYQRREEPSFTRKETGISALFSKELTENLTTTAGYVYRFIDLSNMAQGATIEETDKNYNLASVRLQLTYDTRDDLFFPTSGQKSSLFNEWADRSLGSELALYRITAGTRWFFPLTSAVVVGLRYDTGLVTPRQGTASLPVGERFYNGGQNTVRSFQESELGPHDLTGDPMGGYAYNVASIEFRRRFTEHLSFSMFFDYGNISPNQSPIEQGKEPSQSASDLMDTTISEYFQDFRGAVGCGFQYLLPVGPLRLDLALNPTPRESENPYALHFSVGMAF